MVEEITKSKYSYLGPFLTTREPLHLRDISRKLKENHATVRKYLNDFEALGILKKEFKGRLTLYTLNLDSSLLIDVLTLSEKDKLIRKINSNIIFKEFVFELHKLTNKTTIIFGSSVENFSKANDIDILTTDKNINLKKLEKFNREIHLNYVSSLKSLSETMKKEILKKHLIINNSEEVVKWLV